MQTLCPPKNDDHHRENSDDSDARMQRLLALARAARAAQFRYENACLTFCLNNIERGNP